MIELIDSTGKPKSQARIQREALAEWWARGGWPCVILAADPGEQAGAATIVSRPGLIELVSATAVDTYTDHPRMIVERAADIAENLELPLVLVVEDWPAGGPRGIAQFFGLAETRGVWKWLYSVRRRRDGLKIYIAKVMLQRWRSRVVDETGDRSSGEFVRFTPEQWKEAAHRAALEHFLNSYVPPLDASEATCIGYYAARSDEVAKVLGKAYLKRHSCFFEPLEPLIKPKKKPKKRSK